MHYTNTNNPIDFPVTKYVHIVQVHPVELGEPNLHKVKSEQEFNTKQEADMFILRYNAQDGVGFNPNDLYQAVYLGRVNHETGDVE